MSDEYPTLHLLAAGHTDPGQRRALNEDAWRIADPNQIDAVAERGQLFAVADGMGGHAAGEVASQLAVEILFAEYYGPEREFSSPSAGLEEAILAANSRIYEQSVKRMSQAGMGTTLVAAVVRDEWLTVANVGDSRAYLLRDGQAIQLTHDHSWVAEQIAAGLLTESEAQNHMYRSVVTRCLGHCQDTRVDTFRYALQPGDRVLLCSDGLTNQVSELELIDILSRYAADRAVRELVDQANRYGGPDNITAVVLQLMEEGQAKDLSATEPLPQQSPPPVAQLRERQRLPAARRQTARPPWLWPLGIALVVTVAVVVGWSWRQVGGGGGDPAATPIGTGPAAGVSPPTATASATPSQTPIPSPTPSATPTSSPTPTATPTPTRTPTATPTPRPTPTRTPLPTRGPQLEEGA